MCLKLGDIPQLRPIENAENDEFRSNMVIPLEGEGAVAFPVFWEGRVTRFKWCWEGRKEETLPYTNPKPTLSKVKPTVITNV